MAQDLLIESSVPLPPKVYNRPTKYPTAQLQPGQSYFIPFRAARSEHSLRCSVYKSIFRVKQKEPKRQYTMRKRIEDGIPGVRVWRIK
jgi:hypothetical protein